MAINKPDVLYSKVVEIPERVTLEAWTESKTPSAIDISQDEALIKGITGEVVRVLEPLGAHSPARYFLGLADFPRYYYHANVITRGIR
jgi:5-oxoprolinase (ATP-hydrolysing)